MKELIELAEELREDIVWFRERVNEPLTPYYRGWFSGKEMLARRIAQRLKSILAQVSPLDGEDIEGTELEPEEIAKEEETWEGARHKLIDKRLEEVR